MKPYNERKLPMQKNGKVKVSRSVQLEQALELRLAGATYSNIAKALGVSKGYAWKLIDRAVQEVSEKCSEAAEKIRTIELARLDKLRMVLWPKRADPRVCDSLLRISERTAKLYGLDAPTKTELTGADGGPVQTEQGSSVPDLTKLTDEEIVQLAKINAKLKG